MGLFVRRRVLVWSACISALGLAGCDEGAMFEPPPPPTVGVAQPISLSVQPPRSHAGRLEGSAIIEVRARVTGMLEQVHFKEGELVEKGEVLFTIEKDIYASERDLRVAEAARAEAAAKLAETKLAQVRLAYSQSAASEFELDSAEAEHLEAVAAAQSAQAAVRSAETNLGYTTITAPVAGRVSRSLVDAGNIVSSGMSDALTTIVREEPMYVYFNVSEREVLEYIQANPEREPNPVPIRLELADGRIYDEVGYIDYAGNAIEAGSGTLEIRGSFQNKNRELVSGYFVRVLSRMQPRDAMLVPELSVQRDLTGSYVYAVGPDNIATRVIVELGERIGQLRIVESGLDGSERIVVSGLLQVRPDGPVQPQPGQMPPVPDELIAGDHSSETPADPLDKQPAQSETTEQTGDAS